MLTPTPRLRCIKGREVLYKDAYKPRRPQYRESSSGPWRPFAGGDAPLRLTKCLDAKSKDIAPKVSHVYVVMSSL